VITPASVRRTMAIAVKEYIHIRRDPRSLALAFLLPVVLMVLFGSALSLDLDRVPFAVLDRDQSVQSRDLAAAFSGSRYFSFTGDIKQEEEIDRLLDHRLVLMILVIHPGFGSDILNRKPAAVQIIVDGSDSLTAQLALGYSRSLVGGYRPKGTPQTAFRPIDARIRVWYNPELKSATFTVSGLIALIMIIVGAVLTSLTLAREWERGTMEQLVTTPVRTAEILIGKFLPYFIIGIIDLLLGIILAIAAFDVPLKGSALLLIILSALFLAGALGQGLFISAFARNQLLANQLAIITSFLPAFLLSGFFAPISNMPLPVQAVTYAVPARYAMTICRGIMLKGVGLTVLWPEALFLLIYCTIITFLTLRIFKRKIA
jgi:ABC-2 type transport system permease protein